MRKPHVGRLVAKLRAGENCKRSGSGNLPGVRHEDKSTLADRVQLGKLQQQDDYCQKVLANIRNQSNYIVEDGLLMVRAQSERSFQVIYLPSVLGADCGCFRFRELFRNTHFLSFFQYSVDRGNVVDQYQDSSIPHFRSVVHSAVLLADNRYR